MFVSEPPEGPGHHGCHIPETLQQDLEMVGVLRNTAMITLMIILSVVAFNTDTDTVTTKSSWHLLHKWKRPEELLAAYINPVRGSLSIVMPRKSAQVAVENFLNRRNNLQNTSYKKGRKTVLTKQENPDKATRPSRSKTAQTRQTARNTADVLQVLGREDSSANK